MSEERGLESATIGDLSKALSAAQGEYPALKKSRTAKYDTRGGAGVQYAYADLSDVIECLRAPFAKYELSQSQAIVSVDGHMELITTIRHSSGQWIRSYYPVGLYQRPQEQGSALSYGRRYSLTALAGIMAEDDDDGGRAQNAEPAKAKRQNARPASQNPAGGTSSDEPAPEDPEGYGDAWEPPSGDAGAILDLAAAISQVEGKTADTIIREESEFSGDKGPVFFTDPTTVRSKKWLAGVRAKLEKRHTEKVVKASVPDGSVPF